MSPVDTRDEAEPARDDSHSDSVSDICQSCGKKLGEPGIHGTCPSCLLAQPFAEFWDPREPPTLERVAEALPRFRIDKELGRGALGAVYGAVDHDLGRLVAIKVMTANPENPEFTERFAREASVMAKLNHPHIVTIYDHGAVGDLHYLVMERLEGGTLAELLASKGALPLDRAVQLLQQICSGLEYAHALGVMHRDIKPGNILLDRLGNAKLSDFGLVKVLLYEEFEEVALTRTNMTVGTPTYMAPEQMEWPAQADHRADIYSAGAVFYEMLTGEAPTGRYRKASSFPGIAAKYDAIVDTALHKNPDKRFTQANLFAGGRVT